jgi:hypothetical protein
MSVDGLVFFLQFCSVKVFAFEGIMFKPWHQEACRKGQLNCGEEESDTSSEYPPQHTSVFERTFIGK